MFLCRFLFLCHLLCKLLLFCLNHIEALCGEFFCPRFVRRRKTRTDTIHFCAFFIRICFETDRRFTNRIHFCICWWQFGRFHGSGIYGGISIKANDVPFFQIFRIDYHLCFLHCIFNKLLQGLFGFCACLLAFRGRRYSRRFWSRRGLNLFFLSIFLCSIRSLFW